MFNYKYDGKDIYYLLGQTPTSGTADYINFPTSVLPIYGSTIDRPLPFNYKILGTELNNSNTAFTIQYTSTGPPITNPPLGSNIAYKHISAYCYGGGGGGGGGGGAGADFGGLNGHGGGSGGNGAAGGYAAVVQYPINSGPITLSVGLGGSGGGGGAKNNNGGGQAGTDGNEGGVSSLNISGTTVLQAYGGGLGNRGLGGSGNNKGAAGNTDPNTSNSNATGGNIHTTNSNSPSYPYWPLNNSIGGLGGSGGNAPTSANSGNAGSDGYAVLWFLYQA